MSTIRPDLPAFNPGQAPSAGLDHARRAFFGQALERAQATAAAPLAAPAAPTVSAAPATTAERPMRPGALLDIRV